MTQGLLNSAFHDKATGDRRRDLEEFRAQLAGSVFVEVGRIDAQPLQAVCLPLFKRAEHGLVQVVRFRLAGATGEAQRGLRIELDEGGTAAAPFRHGAQGHDLVAEVLVPEVSAPQRHRARAVGSGEAVLWQGEVLVKPQRKWSISLVHHTHLDVGYTDRQEVVVNNHLQYLDSVLELVDRTQDWDDDARFRWNIEVNWPLERWFGSRSGHDRQRMVEAVRAGQVSVGAMSLNMHTEACAVEELYEMVRFAAELSSTYGVKCTSAMQTDVPGGVTALIEVLSDVGVQYLSVAHNYAGRSVPYLIGGEKLARPFYWKAPSGKRLLVWQTDTLHGNAYMEGNIIGLAESYAVAEETLPYYLTALAERAYPFDSGTWLPEAALVERDPYPHDILHLRVQGKYGDNAPPNLAVSEIARQWNTTWAYPHLRVDRSEEFFQNAERKLGDAIPEWQGDWADWWADGLGSGARMLGWARQAQGSVRVARTLHALSDVVAGTPPAHLHELHQTYEDIGLFDEHTWGARHPWGDDEEGWGSGDLQWQRKASFAQDAREAATSLLNSGARRFAEQAGASGALASVVVINSSGWARADLVKVFLPFSTIPASVDVAVEDGRDGHRLATRSLAQDHAAHRPAGRFLVFRAVDVPALGYVRFNVVEGDPAAVTVSLSSSPLENEHYQVSFSLPEPSIRSVVDRATGRELVNQSALLGLNTYVFDRYATSTRVDHLSGRVFSRALDLIADRVTGDAAVVLRRETSDLGDSITLDVRAPGCSRFLSTVSLWRGIPRVDIENRIWKLRTVDKQSVFFAFPFAVSAPKLIYELPGAGTSADAKSVPGSPQHMRAIRHWAALKEGAESTAWATVDAPLVQFGDIHSPYSPFPGSMRLSAPEPGTVYSWALNNIWDTNFPTEQGGEMNFRYAIASSASDEAEVLGMRLGESVSTPLIATVVPTGFEQPGSSPTGSFCAIGRPEVRLVQLTAARAGEDLLLWLNNLAEYEVTTAVTFPELSIGEARLGTVFEQAQVPCPISAGSVEVTLRAGETKALAVRAVKRRDH